MANQGGGLSTVVVLAFWGRLLRGAGGMEGWAEAGMGVEVRFGWPRWPENQSTVSNERWRIRNDTVECQATA